MPHRQKQNSTSDKEQPMAKYENIRALAKKKLQAVTESSDRWKAFLRTAAIAYNYSFPNQLLIHEQSPTATAVADIAYWNNNAGRWASAARTVSRYLTRGQILPGCGICLTFPIPSPAQRFPKRCRGSLQTRTGGLFGIKL